MRLLSRSTFGKKTNRFVYHEKPSYKESLDYDVETSDNLRSTNDEILKSLKGQILRVNTNNTNSTARIYYEKNGGTTVVDGIADGQPVKVLGHQTINGEVYLRIGYNLKKDGSYVGEGFMKPRILHNPKQRASYPIPKPPVTPVPVPKPKIPKSKPKPFQNPKKAPAKPKPESNPNLTPEQKLLKTVITVKSGDSLAGLLYGIDQKASNLWKQRNRGENIKGRHSEKILNVNEETRIKLQTFNGNDVISEHNFALKEANQSSAFNLQEGDIITIEKPKIGNSIIFLIKRRHQNRIISSPEKSSENITVVTKENIHQFTENINNNHFKAKMVIKNTLSDIVRLIEKISPLREVAILDEILKPLEQNPLNLTPEERIHLIGTTFIRLRLLTQSLESSEYLPELIKNIEYWENVVKKDQKELEKQEKKLEPYYRSVQKYQKINKISNFPEAELKFGLEVGPMVSFQPVKKRTLSLSPNSILHNLYNNKYKREKFTSYEVPSFTEAGLGSNTTGAMTTYGDIILINKESTLYKKTFSIISENEIAHLIFKREFPFIEGTDNNFETFKHKGIYIKYNTQADEFLSDVASLHENPKEEIERILINSSIPGGRIGYQTTETFMVHLAKNLIPDPDLKDFIKTGKISEKLKQENQKGSTFFHDPKDYALSAIIETLTRDTKNINFIKDQYKQVGQNMVSHLRNQRNT